MNTNDFSQMMETSVSAVEAENNIGPDSNNNITYSQPCEILPPAKDTYYSISSTVVEKLKSQCENCKSSLPIISDLLLTFASLFLGAFISAFISNVEFKPEFISIFFYCVAPILGFSCLTACIFTKKMSKDMESKLSEKVIEYVIEPIELKQREHGNEH